MIGFLLFVFSFFAHQSCARVNLSPLSPQMQNTLKEKPLYYKQYLFGGLRGGKKQTYATRDLAHLAKVFLQQEAFWVIPLR